MRPLLYALGALVVGSLAAADLLPLENHDFQKRVKSGELPGFEVDGKVATVETEGHGRRALRVEKGTTLVARCTIPEAPKPDDVDPDGWYLWSTLDVLRVEGGREAKVTLSLFRAERAQPFAKQTLEVLRADDSPARLELFVPAKTFASFAGQDLRAVIDVAGATAVLDDLCLQRFHLAPTRKLLGKANGKLGPDLLASGALGFDALTEHHHTAFSVLAVRDGGSADRAGLEAGDLVVGVGEGRRLPSSSVAPGWAWLEESHEARLGRAIEAALGDEVGDVTLRIVRKGKERELTLALPFPHALVDGFPLRGGLGELLRADLVSWCATHQKSDGSWKGSKAVNPALGGLALLSTRDPEHAEAIERTVDWLLAQNPAPSEMRGLAYWTIAFQGIFFAEYFLASGDDRVVPWMEEALAWLPTTTHECTWGMQAFGHGPDGLPYGEKALMAPTAHLLVFDALARRCGLETEVWEHVEDYVVHSWSDPDEPKGHGGMGYNASFKDKGEFWSRSGLVALAEALRGGKARMRNHLATFMEERHPWMLNSHAYGEPGGALGLIALSVVRPEALETILPHWRWRFLNAWEPGYGLRYSTPHMGAPYMGTDEIVNLGYCILGSVPRKGLVLTGGTGDRWL